MTEKTDAAQLLEGAARLRQLAEKSEELAAKAPLSAADREELLAAARSCRKLAAEMEAAAGEESQRPN